MGCKNVSACMQKASRWKIFQQTRLPLAEKEHDEFISIHAEGEGQLIFSKHLLKRQLERGISRNDVQSVIRLGWPIERIETTGDVTILFLYHVHAGGVYRPLHVSCVFSKNDSYRWKVKTTYDPRSNKWKWDENYQRRICFCDL